MAPVRSGFAINPSSSPSGKISYHAPFGWNKLSHPIFAVRNHQSGGET
jgi:hypothetical protein